MGILNQITPVISNAGILKRNAGLPISVTAACSLFSSSVKRDHKIKSHNFGVLPAALAAHLGRFPLSLSCFVFFPPVCRKRTASVCKCCCETRPPKCLSFSSPRNYLPSDSLPDYTWSRFCSATVRHRPDPSFTLCELYLLCTYKKKKGSHQTLDLTRLRKHLQDLHSLKYQVSNFLFYLTGCF